MKHITRIKTITAVILALLMAFAVFGAAVAVAEGEDESSQAAGDESSESGGESSEDAGTSSEDESSGDDNSEGGNTDDSSGDPVDPDAYRITFTVNGAEGSALCYFGGSDTPATEYVGTEANLSVRVVAAEHYELDSVNCVVPMTVTDKTESTFELSPSKNDNLTILALTTRKAEPVSLTINAFGADSVSVKCGEEEEQTYSAPLSVLAGTQVTVKFNIGGTEFDPEKSDFSVNGFEIALSANEYTFTLEANTDIIFSYDSALVRFVFHGPATASIVGGESIVNNKVGDYTAEKVLRLGSALQFTVSPAVNYKLDSVTCNGNALTADGKIYAVEEEVLAQNPSIEIKVSAAGTTPPAKKEFNVTVLIVGSGGKLTAGAQTINGNAGTLIKVAEGDELSITVKPDAGYLVDYFRVGGENKKLTDNKYTFKVTADTQVTAAFKPENDVPPAEGITVKDVDWEKEQIVVDVSSQHTVLREVFEKIASETKGKAVEFRGVHGSVIVPTGVPFDGSASSANIEIVRVSSGEAYNTAGGLLKLGKPDAIPFAMYSFDFGLGMPEGTSVILKTGAALAGENVELKLYDGVNAELYAKEGVSEPYKASSDGTVGPIPYGNEGIFVLAKEVGEIPEVVLECGEGGTLTASPYNNVQKTGDDYTFYVNAQNGYTVSSLRVDGVEIGEAVGKKTFQYSFKVTSQKHTVNVAFAAENTGEEPGSGGSGKTGPILAIILVALAGAAALFIVKWRQEKY